MTVPTIRPDNPIFLQLRLMLSEITGNEIEDIYLDSSLLDDLNMTPMEIAQFFALVRQEFPGVILHKGVLEEMGTLSDLTEYIEEMVS